ncbi:hypothetical protein QUF72_05050 [Desulfobacterales bacterium HSG2]|nr:hypothetical protein [Desulfobacterales bacterium HSG2]
MSDKLSDQDLKDARELLDNLFEEVSSEEGTLAGGMKLGRGGKTLQSLRETKVSFGNPNNNLIHLTEELFGDIEIELTPIHEQQMRDRFDFYYMTLAVSMQPGRDVQFTSIACELDFAPKGSDEPIVQSIFPKSEWREMLRLGRQMSLGLNGNLGWSAGINPSDMPMLENLPGSIRANIENKNEIKAFIAVPNYSFELGKTDIAATGEGNSECFWRIEKPDLQKAQTVQFGVVFKVPKGVSSIELTGLVSAEPSFRWLTADLGDVFEYLSDNLKRVLSLKDDERRGGDRLPVGDHEKWMIDLPN